MDDTLADLNVRTGRGRDHHHHHLDPDSEANKENDNSGPNNISLFVSGDEDLPDMVPQTSDEPHPAGMCVWVREQHVVGRKGREDMGT